MGKKRKVAGGEDGEAVKEAAAPKVLLKRELFIVLLQHPKSTAP